MRETISQILSLRAWKLALVGPTVYWYFSLFFGLMIERNSPVSVLGTILILVALILSVSWGFMLNDLFDRDADASAGRSDSTHGHFLGLRTIWTLILGTALLSWVLVFLSDASWITMAIFAVDYLVAILYSVPPFKLKIRAILGFIANSVMERPLPILVLLSYVRLFNYEIILLPILSELTWSVFKHQAADVLEDSKGGVKTFAVRLGPDLSYRIVNRFLNPLSVFSLFALVGLAWLELPPVRLVSAAVCGFMALGTALVLLLEKKKVLTFRVTVTDPPYIVFLNVSYRFLILPAIGVSLVVLLPAFYPLLVVLGITLCAQGVIYASLAQSLIKHKVTRDAVSPPTN